MHVNVDNFTKAETARMFDNTLAMTGGVNWWAHVRKPTPIDAQPVIRMNRDTLYSGAVVDISESGTVSLPEADGRYMTLAVINEGHYINRVFSNPGTYELTAGEFGSPFVSLTVRTFVDPSDEHDVAHVNALQDAIGLDVNASRPFTHPDYDEASLAATREALLALGEGVPDTSRRSGARPTSKRRGTSSGRPWAGVAFPRPRPTTTSSPSRGLSGDTRSRSRTFPSTPSGR